jgi:antitoxin (DNA-binding transcriptional repressor) of toxin-antitoxin stability system
MKSIELADVAALAPHLQAGAWEPVIVTMDGRTVAAVVPTDEGDVEDLLLSVNARFQAILERSQQRLETEGSVSGEEVRRRLGLPIV